MQISALPRRFLDLWPEDRLADVLAAMSTGNSGMSNLESEFAAVDWNMHRDALEEVIRELVPIEDLVPEVYEKWRPVFRDGFSFIASRLSPDRLAPKLLEQLSLPESTPVEERIFAFIRRVPILQKIGQTLARNNKLDAKLRTQLICLEDGIHEIDESEILEVLESQLGDRLQQYRVKLEPGIYGEGSVSAVMRFTYTENPDAVPSAAVFKVLKPFIPVYFDEDITLLAELADYFDANLQKYNFGDLNLHAILNDVRDLYEREIDFSNERENLVAAGFRYGGMPGVHIPRPITVLSTETITAMTNEPGGKITEAFPLNLQRRRELARRMVECLVARPLFSGQKVSPFHADPHVGNLRVNEVTGDIILLDWALTGSLSEADRRSLILLFLMLPLRDEGQIVTALEALGVFMDHETREHLKMRTEAYIDTLPRAGLFPSFGGFNDFFDDLLAAGIRFSGSILVFRKMLLTLEDVVEKVSPGETIQQIVLGYAISYGLLTLLSPNARQSAFNLPLKASDVVRLGLSVQSYFPRLWLQSVRRSSNREEVCSTKTTE